MQREVYRNPIPTTDLLLEYQGGLVLITRKNPPHGLALPGGFHDYGLSGRQNAIKEGKEETNLEVEIECLLGEYSDPKRDPRGHMISLAYIAQGTGNLRAGDDALVARVYKLNEIQRLVEGGCIDGLKLVFDHAEILLDYLAFRFPENLTTQIKKAEDRR